MPAVTSSAAASQQLLKRLALMAGLVSLCFCVPLFGLVRLAFKEELVSYVLLIPAVSGYLIWIRRESFPAVSRSAFGLSALIALPGLGALVSFFMLKARGVALSPVDSHALTTLAYVSLLVAGAVFAIGRERAGAIAFPLAFLIFMVPLPDFMTLAIEDFLTRASAEASSMFFSMLGTPVYREGQFFKLPGITIEVARECSGIRSTLVLFITCLLAGNMFLRQNWGRGLLVLAVVPLGILRNAFRVVTISLLCIHIDSSMIHSPIHTQGGPVFFALSLIPLFLILFGVRRIERRRQTAGSQS